MTRKTHTLMVVHAHPDDEASSTGGLLRFAAEQGHTTIVVTCTQGDLGEVKMPGVRLNPRQDTTWKVIAHHRERRETRRK